LSSPDTKKAEEVEPGRAVLCLDAEETYLNGSGSPYGEVCASLLDTKMGLSVSSPVGLRVKTQINAHFLGAVCGGRTTCRSEVVSIYRTATAEGDHNEEGNLMVTGTFMAFEKKV